MSDDLMILQEAGLSPREADIYYQLLKLGESPISDLLKVTHHHPQVIYRVIEALTEKKLVTVVERRHRKYARAEDPGVLTAGLEGRLQHLTSLLPTLRALQTPTAAEAVVRVAKGPEAVRDLRSKGIDRLQSGESYDIINASGSTFFQIMGPLYARLERQRLKKGIRRRVISFESQRQQIVEQEPSTEQVEYRYLSSDYPALQSINLFADTVAFIIWSDDPIVITIESNEIAKGYREYFESLWLLGRP